MYRESLKRLLSCWQAAGLSHWTLAPFPRPLHPAHPMAGLKKGAQGATPTVPVLGALCQPPCPDSAMPHGRALRAPRIAQMAPLLLLCLPRCPGLWAAQNHLRAHPPLHFPWLPPTRPTVPLSLHFLKNDTCRGLGSSHRHQPEAPISMSPLHLLSQMSPNPQSTLYKRTKAVSSLSRIHQSSGTSLTFPETKPLPC